MHADSIDSGLSDPNRTPSGFKRAREVLLLRRRTRSADLKARKEALRLYISFLPTEMMMAIFKSFLSGLFGTLPSLKALLACSLVCRKWSTLAQISLHTHVLVANARGLSLLHRTLTSSDQFGWRVHRFGIIVPPNQPPNAELPIPVHQMIADCLERTPKVKVLCLDVRGPATLTNDIIQRLESLTELSQLQLNQGNFPGRPNSTSGFDPMLLRFLPSSVEKLRLARPLRDLVRVLPDILQRVYPSQNAAQVAGPSADTPAQPEGGLKLLEFTSIVSGTSNAINFAALISTTSIPATLTRLSLTLVSRSDNNEQEQWNNFIGSCKHLLELEIGLTLIAPSIFRTLPPLELLRTLIVVVHCRATQSQWEEFGNSLIGYAAQTPCVREFALKAEFLANVTAESVEHFIRHLLPEFYTGDQCRLRSLAFGFFNSPTLDAIDRVGPEMILENSHFVAPSIDTFELLCKRATLLQHLEIAVPLDFLPRVATAIESLKELRSLYLHNYSLILDPRVPLRKMTAYKKFLRCCKLLKQHLRVAG